MNHITSEQREQYESLKALVRAYDISFFQHHNSVVSDERYDKIYRELEAMERKLGIQDNDSPTYKLNDIGQTGTVVHDVPMLSLSKTYYIGELEKWLSKTELKLRKHSKFSCGYTLELKADGLAATVKYTRNGITTIATRGTGRNGDDITYCLPRINRLPRNLNPSIVMTMWDEIEVRGELVVLKEDFKCYNATHDKTYSTPRHLAAAIATTVDCKIDVPLYFIAYDYISSKANRMFDYHRDNLIALTDSGFDVGVFRWISSMELTEEIRLMTEVVESTLWPCDGLVLKVSSLAGREFLGATAKVVKWGMAYKFTDAEHRTIVTGITWSVGKGGTHTAVAAVDPFVSNGITVSNVVLAGLDKYPKIGAEVGVVLKGTVIPQLVAIYGKTARPKLNGCISCGSRLDDLTCLNPNCNEIIKHRLIDAFSRNGLDVKGMGESIIGKLIKAGFTTLSEIVCIGLEDWLSVVGDSEAMVKMHRTISSFGYGLPFANILYSLGIRGMGYSNALLVAKRINSLLDLLDCHTLLKGRITEHLYGEINTYAHNNREEIMRLNNKRFSYSLI